MLIKLHSAVLALLVLLFDYSLAHPIAVKVTNASLPAEVFLSKQKTAIKSTGIPVHPENHSARLFEWITNMFSANSASGNHNHGHDYDCDYHHDDYHHDHHGHGHGHDYYDDYDEYDEGGKKNPHRRPNKQPSRPSEAHNIQAMLPPAADQSKVVMSNRPPPLPNPNQQVVYSPNYLPRPQQYNNLQQVHPIRIRLKNA